MPIIVASSQDLDPKAHARFLKWRDYNKTKRGNYVTTFRWNGQKVVNLRKEDVDALYEIIDGIETHYYLLSESYRKTHMVSSSVPSEETDYWKRRAEEAEHELRMAKVQIAQSNKGWFSKADMMQKEAEIAQIIEHKDNYTNAICDFLGGIFSGIIRNSIKADNNPYIPELGSKRLLVTISLLGHQSQFLKFKAFCDMYDIPIKGKSREKAKLSNDLKRLKEQGWIKLYSKPNGIIDSFVLTLAGKDEANGLLKQVVAAIRDEVFDIDGGKGAAFKNINYVLDMLEQHSWVKRK
jgi:hypothetical protein